MDGPAWMGQRHTGLWNAAHTGTLQTHLQLQRPKPLSPPLCKPFLSRGKSTHRSAAAGARSARFPIPDRAGPRPACCGPTHVPSVRRRAVAPLLPPPLAWRPVLPLPLPPPHGAGGAPAAGRGGRSLTAAPLAASQRHAVRTPTHLLVACPPCVLPQERPYHPRAERACQDLAEVLQQRVRRSGAGRAAGAIRCPDPRSRGGMEPAAERQGDARQIKMPHGRSVPTCHFFSSFIWVRYRRLMGRQGRKKRGLCLEYSRYRQQDETPHPRHFYQSAACGIYSKCRIAGKLVLPRAQPIPLMCEHLLCMTACPA